ncbi:MAG: DUF1801 domain-containing protein, partial [Proteobacteria bacterium]|nr:DUF1801 domain-containing protein [Pseudomonadota bacterium]
QELIDEIAILDIEKFEMLIKLRDIVFSCDTEIQERVMYGGIMFSLEKDFGGLFVRKKHISFEFSFGAGMNDPDGLLEGTGKFRRHLKLHSLKDIKIKNVLYFIKQTI